MRWDFPDGVARLALVFVLGVTPFVSAQSGMVRTRAAATSGDVDEHVPYDGRFAFVRLRYDTGGFGFGGFRREAPWHHDYPRAERHLMRILQEVTLLRPHLDESNILTLDDPELMNYPMAYMSEPGFWTMDDGEMTGLRNYIRKGGFVHFDDFRGEHWFNFEEQIRKVFPEGRIVQLDASHPIFHSFFEINVLDSLRPYGLPPTFHGMYEGNDPSKRLLWIASYNNDIGEYMEWSDTGWQPIDLTNDAYKFAVNFMVYAMTH